MAGALKSRCLSVRSGPIFRAAQAATHENQRLSICHGIRLRECAALARHVSCWSCPASVHRHLDGSEPFRGASGPSASSEALRHPCRISVSGFSPSGSEARSQGVSWSTSHLIVHCVRICHPAARRNRSARSCPPRSIAEVTKVSPAASMSPRTSGPCPAPISSSISPSERMASAEPRARAR